MRQTGLDIGQLVLERCHFLGSLASFDVVNAGFAQGCVELGQHQSHCFLLFRRSLTIAASAFAWWSARPGEVRRLEPHSESINSRNASPCSRKSVVNSLECSMAAVRAATASIIVCPVFTCSSRSIAVARAATASIIVCPALACASRCLATAA